MRFVKTTGWEDGVADLAERLIRELANNKKVLWLVTGGSNIKASVNIMKNIPTESSRHLSVLLADERYGPPGHADSNWTQLLAAGFEGKKARLLPILRASNSFEQAAAGYEALARQAFADNELVIAQIGIGSDGHVAGILPNSIAVQEDKALVCAYLAEPYQRLTMTFPALRHIDVNYSFAFGEPKSKTLRRLQSESISIAEQPAQILKELPEAYVYNDQIGESR